MSFEVFFRPNDKITIKLECRDAKGLFEELGPLQEVLSSCECGKCKSKDVRFLHRKVDKYDYYELQCNACRAKLSFGTDQESKSLFPRRYEQDPDDPKKPLVKDGQKVWLPNNGWVKWDASKGQNV